jgi:low temperature requirement protein LtrA
VRVITAGLRTAVGHPGATLAAGPALALAGGVTLFLAGDVAFRRVLALGPPRYRLLAAAAALAAWPLAMSVDAAAGIALLTAVVAGALAVEGRAGHDTVEA